MSEFIPKSTSNDFYGYVPDPDATARFVNKLPRSFAQQVQNLVGDDDSDAFPYRHLAKALEGSQHVKAGRLRARNQGSVGSCVGNGGASAADGTAAGDIHARGEPETWPTQDGKPIRTSADYSYGAGRHISGNLGRWDGSYGSVQAKAYREWGACHERRYRGVDLSEYSEERCRRYAAKGIPNTLIEAAKDHPFRTTTLVESREQARALLQNSYFLSVCSGQGFNGRRDADGFMRANQRWAHCMCVCGYRGGRRRGFLIWNSWGSNWGSGPLWPADMPFGAFWCDWDIFGRMLRTGDTFAFGGYQGFRASPFDWERGLGW